MTHEQSAKLVLALAFASAALSQSYAVAQTDLGCFGDRGYRMLKNGETVYAPILCEFGEDDGEYIPTLKETKRLYIENLPEDLKQKALEHERKKNGEPSENWKKFLNQTGRSFD